VPRLRFVSISFCLLLINVPALASAGTLVSDIDQCIKQLARAQGKGNVRLKAELDFYCPGLTDKVKRSPISRNLSWEFDSSSSVAELRDLRQFLATSRGQSASSGFRFKYENVGKIVGDVLQKAPEVQPGLWDRFVEWIKQYLPKMDQEDIDKFDNFVKSITMPKWLNDVVFYGSGALILIAALWILLREWRYYRRVGAYRRAAFAGGEFSGNELGREPVALESLPELPLQRRVPALLYWAINYFETRGDLPRNHSLTNRELLRILFRKKSRNSDYFSDLVGESERIVYGNAEPTEERVEELLQVARQLQSSPGETAS